jgi:hypothetical protein
MAAQKRGHRQGLRKPFLPCRMRIASSSGDEFEQGSHVIEELCRDLEPLLARVEDTKRDMSATKISRNLHCTAIWTCSLVRQDFSG